jgi:hypothetical protein
MLLNCDLSDAPAGTQWLEGFFAGPTGTQTVENGMLKVFIESGGTDTWMVQPRQQGLVLTPETTYVVRFNAMASIARGMLVSLTENGGTFESYSGQQTFALTTELQEFTFEFTTRAGTLAADVKLEFLLGGAANNPTVPNTVYFDNLFLAPVP